MAEPLHIAHDALAMIGYGHEPAVLVVTDSEGAAELARGTVGRAEGRIRSVTPVKGAIQALDTQLIPHALWIEIEQDPGTDLDRLLDRVDWETRAGRFEAVIVAPSALIDPIAARTLHSRIQHLCDPSDEERLEAIALALSPPVATLHDVNRGSNGRLQQISVEVGRIAAVLAELSEEENVHAAGPAQSDKAISASTIRAIIRARRLRERFFPNELFADPAWDMMLDLMAARLEDRQVAVSSLCIAAAVPPTTALRWIKTLTSEGVFARQSDPQDGRRVYVELTDSAAASFEAYLRAVSRTGSLVI